MQLAAHEFWQEILPPGSLGPGPDGGHDGLYPAELADGRQIALPIRALPGDDGLGVASLIVNQASFAVEDALAAAVAGALRPFAPEIVVGVPTLGLPLAAGVARRLGHRRMVPLGTSRKFWYDDELSVPLSSITSPGGGKRLYLDPRMLPVLAGRRVAVVEDVISTGSSAGSVLSLLAAAGTEPVALAFAMLQTERWRPALAGVGPSLPGRVLGAIRTPLLSRGSDGRWRPAGGG